MDKQQNTGQDYVDRAYSWARRNWPASMIIICLLILSGLAQAVESIKTIYNDTTRAIAVFSSRELTDAELIKQSRQLATEIIKYKESRSPNEPQFDFNHFDESVRAQSQYSRETVGYYTINFEPTVARYKFEFAKRSIHNDELDNFYDNPINPIGVGEVAMRLNDMAAQLQATVNKDKSGK